MLFCVVSNRVTTHLENLQKVREFQSGQGKVGENGKKDLEKSGNSKVVREKSGKMEKVRGSEIRCVFFKL